MAIESKKLYVRKNDSLFSIRMALLRGSEESIKINSKTLKDSLPYAPYGSGEWG